MKHSRQLLRRILLSNYMLAAVIAIPIFFILPGHPTRYLLKEVAEIPLVDGDRILYRDINHDGISETVHMSPGDGIPILIIANPDGSYFHESKFLGSYFKFAPVVFTDFNKNNTDEISFFMQRNDSVFLTWGELFLDRDPVFHEKFVFPITYFNNIPAVKVDRVLLFDPKQSGDISLLMAVSAGYSRQPRQIYRYSFASDSLLSTGPIGFGCVSMEIADLNHDGSKEVILGSSASANYPDTSSIRFSDRSTWVIVLNDHLHPVDSFCVHENPGAMYAYPFNKADSTYLLVHYAYGGTKPVQNFLSLFNSRMERSIDLKIPDLQSIGKIIYILPWKGKNAIYYFSFPGRLTIYDNSLKQQKSVKYPENNMPAMLLGPINLGHQNYFLFQENKSKKLCFMAPGGNIVAETDYKYKGYFDFPYFGKRLQRGQQEHFFITQNNQVNEYDLRRNPFWYLRWVSYISIYAGILLFLFLSQRLYQLQIRRQQRIKHEILQLQLSSALGHLEPHFTFNALNTMGMLISSGEKDNAYRYLMHFSKLLQQLLTSSDEITVPLSEEISFIENFLALQKYSLGDKLKYFIDEAGPEMRDFPVPKRLLQNHVENAIKHGIRPKKGGGQVELHMRKEGDKVIITIDDNGVGRSEKQQEPKNDSTGQGIKITLQMLQSLQDLGIYRSIAQNIIDILDRQGNPAGTQVVISIEK